MKPKQIGVLFLIVAGVLVAGLFLMSRGENSKDETSNVKGQSQVIENVTPEKAHNLIQDNKENDDFVILDLRTPDEYAGGHIEGATNLDYYSDTFRDELEKLDKNKIYLIHCQSGRRSTAALETMKNLGFKKVYNMTGGIAGWQVEGLATTK